MKRFVALDRDGTIIVERQYLSDPAEVELLPNASFGMRTMAELGLGLIVLTNQSGIGRGLFDRDILDGIHLRMRELLENDGVTLSGIYYCPHLPADDCECRKPRLGMLQAAARDMGFNPRDIFMIGDKPCDIEMGAAANATTLLVRTGYGREYPVACRARPDFSVNDLAEAADVIRSRMDVR